MNKFISVLFILGTGISGCSEEVDDSRVMHQDVVVRVRVTGPSMQEEQTLGSTDRLLISGDLLVQGVRSYSSTGELPEAPMSVYDMTLSIVPQASPGTCRIIGSKGTSYLRNARLLLNSSEPSLIAGFVDPKREAVLDQFGQTIYRNGKLETKVVSNVEGTFFLHGAFETRGNAWSIVVDVAEKEDGPGEICGCGFVASVTKLNADVPGAFYQFTTLDPTPSVVFRVSCNAQVDAEMAPDSVDPPDEEDCGHGRE